MKLPSKITTSVLLRVGLAFVFIYAAYASLAKPQDWIGFVPHAITNIVQATTFLKIMSVYELALGAWLLTGYCVRIAGLLSALTLAGIVIGNPSAFEISFRDVGLFLMAVALALPKTVKD